MIDCLRLQATKQEIVVDFQGKGMFILKILEVEVVIDLEDGPKRCPRGMMGRATTTYFDQAGSHASIGFVNAPEKPKQLMKMDVNLKELGIGGLKDEFSEIFRRAFATRMYPRALIDRMGVQHVKGILIHGGPGTGTHLQQFLFHLSSTSL